MKQTVAVLVALLFAAAARAQSPGPEAAGIRVQSSTDRSILLLGQPVIYTLSLDYGPGITIVADDLRGDALQLEGLDLVDSRLTRDVNGDGSGRLVATYTLRSFEPGPAARRVAPRVVRYAVTRPGAAESASLELPIPAVELAWRSVLPDEIQALQLKALAPSPSPSAMARTIATGSAIGAAALFAWLLLSRRPSTAQAGPRVDLGDLKTQLLAELDRLTERPAATEDDRRQRAGAIETAIRRYAVQAVGPIANAMTSGEFAARTGERIPHADELAAVIAQCERLRFRRTVVADDNAYVAAVDAARAWCART